MTPVRMFVAVTPPASAIDHLNEFLAPRREAGPFRWTLPETYHVTLAFCPDVPDKRLDDFIDGLERAAHKRRAFDTRITGGGAFPNVASAKLLYAGLELDDQTLEELRRMAVGARAAATRAGIEVDGARFKPHITLGRLSHALDVSNWVRLLDGYEGPTWRADRIELIASYLGEGPGGKPRYETVADFVPRPY